MDAMQLTVRCTVCLLLCGSGGISQLPLVWFSCVTLLAAADPASLSEERSQVEAAVGSIQET